MRHVPVAEFKDNASHFIAAAERGEEIIITRHGKPTARLVAAEQAFDPAKRREALALSRALREKMRAQGRTATLEDMIAWKNEGRR